jgi:sodium pump decarboxylase gamma subunit
MSNNISLGLELMGLGMTIVFLFLLLLIFSISIMSFCVQQFQSPPKDTIPETPVQEIDSNIVAAITLAVNRYRRQ